MDLILRTFKVDDRRWLVLVNRCVFDKTTTTDLIHKFVDKFLANAVVIAPSDETDLVLRSVYLTPEQDAGLAKLAETFQTTKGVVFRAAIAAGLGF